MNSTKKKGRKKNKIFKDKTYETSSNISEFNLDELKNESIFSEEKDDHSKIDEYPSNRKYNKKVHKTYKEKIKHKSGNNLKNKCRKEENKKLKKEINNIDLNNIQNQIPYNNIDNNINYKKSSYNLNNHREERPIRPLDRDNIFNSENPFGVRLNRSQKERTLHNKKRLQNSMLYINNYNYNDKSNKNRKENKEANGDDSHEYEYNRVNSVKFNTRRNINILNKDDKPVRGGKIFDYEEIFGKGGEINFKGDPFGGAKQFETNKSKIHHNRANSTALRKRPIYDAKKAIAEAKIKEEKEGNKEKHTQFRDFLKEIKNDTKKENLNKKKKYTHNKINKNNYRNNNSMEIKNSYNESINKSSKNIENGALKSDINAYRNNNNTEYENKNIEYNKKKDSNHNTFKGKSMEKSSNRMLRKRLHDLEKAPAPVLNIKGAKSKIECWFDNSINNNRNKFMEYSTQKNSSCVKYNGQNKIKKPISGEIRDNKNHKILSKKLKHKIEDYVENKLSQLYIQIDKINDIFSIETYFKQKETKMRKFKNIPYIKESNFYIKKYTNEVYDIIFNDINNKYKKFK